MGKKVRAEAELVAIDRRKLTFKVKVYDEIEQVGEAEHERFVIDSQHLERFRKKIGVIRAAASFGFQRELGDLRSRT
jgi:predicted thioesterase